MENTTNTHPRILGTLRDDGGAGVVRLEDRFATSAEDLWSALTDPARLDHWLGEVDGDLREGGTFTGRWHASGWEGTLRVEACERPRRILLHSSSPDEPDGGLVELTLTADGEHTVLVVEDHGVPLENIAAYGAGNQIHVEDLASYLGGGERCDARTRFGELFEAYRQVDVG